MRKLIFLSLLLLSLISVQARKPVIFMIGDSTMANKPIDNENPERGWGHALPGFMTEDIIVSNHAKNGQGTRSFLKKRWQEVYDSIQPGDFVFIQFAHNDEPGKGGHTEPFGEFSDNLARFVTDTRSKGAKPVLFTPIVRRKFVTDTINNTIGPNLIDTHGDYVKAVKKVGKDLSVPCVDLNKMSQELVEKMGPEESKTLFMHIAPGTCPACPEGKVDDTHLTPRGARAIASMGIDGAAKFLIELKPYIRHYDYVVAKDGTGDFFTIQEAIDAVPVNRFENRTTILVRDGVYNEKVTIPANRPNISLIGQGNPVITFDDYADRLNRFGEKYGTAGSSTVYIFAPDFYAENITFENTAGNVGQAVACYTDGDRSMFKNCRFLGNQDTLYTHDGRQYYEDCYIEGTVDFIFGKATALFNRCDIHSKRSGSYLTAPATPEGTKYGYVFYDCDLTADDGVENVYLSRPWRAYGKTVFVRCRMGNHIHPKGWNNWGKKEREKTAYYAETECTGPGADTSHRAFGHVLPNAKDYRVNKILLGSDNWNPVDHRPDPTPIFYP